MFSGPLDRSLFLAIVGMIALFFSGDTLYYLKKHYEEYHSNEAAIAKYRRIFFAGILAAIIGLVLSLSGYYELLNSKIAWDSDTFAADLAIRIGLKSHQLFVLIFFVASIVIAWFVVRSMRK